MIETVYASDSAEETTEVFESQEAFLRFKEEFEQEMEKALAEQRYARAQSEEDIRSGSTRDFPGGR